MAKPAYWREAELAMAEGLLRGGASIATILAEHFPGRTKAALETVLCRYRNGHWTPGKPKRDAAALRAKLIPIIAKGVVDLPTLAPHVAKPDVKLHQISVILNEIGLGRDERRRIAALPEPGAKRRGRRTNKTYAESTLKRAIIMRDEHGMSWPEIAAAVGHSQNSLEATVCRYRKLGWERKLRSRSAAIDKRIEHLVLVDGHVSVEVIAAKVGLRRENARRRCLQIGLDAEMRRELAGTEKVAA